MRTIGRGLEPLKTFCSVMDFDPPVTQNAYDKICQRINMATKSVAIDSMRKAAEEEVSLTKSTDITISGDGTWKTRGHTSHIGVCSVIGAETGKVIDIEVLSSTCKGCENWKGPRSGKKYDEWQKEHSGRCLKNHTGSSGKMEVDGMVKIFHRSEAQRGVRYINYIGDGDTKTFSAVSESNPYPETPISKLECIGHVQKRMGSRLRKLKQDYKSKKLSDGKGLSGKGRLTDSIINKLTVYYGNAIRKNSNSVNSMRNAIWAIYFHTRSNDKEPLHSFCPIDVSSWCKYNQAVASGNVNNFHHADTLPAAIMDVIKPVFNALTKPELLKRCLGSHTQNPNESFNSLIWQICPKVSGSGRIIAEIAAQEAILMFNEGQKGRLSVMKALSLCPGINCATFHYAKDIKRIKCAEERHDKNTLEARRLNRLKKLNLLSKLSKEEGVTYESGAF